MLGRLGRTDGRSRFRKRPVILTSVLTLSLVCIAVLIASDGSEAAANGVCGENASWLYENGTLTISGLGPMDDYSSESDITPWNEYRDSIVSVVINDGVTSVGDYSFYGYTALYSVSLPDSMVSAGLSPFDGCTNLTELTLPVSLDPVTSNDAPAFAGCTNIQSVGFTRGTGISHNYTVDGSGTYCVKTPWYLSRSKLTSVTLPGDITSVGDYMFFGCDRIASVTIPDTVTYIGIGAFSNCTGLRALTLPASVDAVSSNDAPAFKECHSIETIGFTKGDGSWFPYAAGPVGTQSHFHFTPWYYSRNVLTDADFESGITSIGDFAFQDCTALESVFFPNSLTVIGVSSFDGCTSLTDVRIPDGVASIGGSAFRGCTGMDFLSLPISLNAVSSNAYPAFEGCVYISAMAFTMGTGSWHAYSQSSSLSGDDCYLYTPWYLSKGSLGTLTIDYGVTDVSEWQFNGFTALITVNLPDSVTSLAGNAFSECVSLTDIPLPNHLVSIGPSCFDGCRSLRNVILPDTLTTIGDFAFRGCVAMDSITLPDTMTLIGQNAFRDCSISVIDIPDTLSSVGDNAFAGCPLRDVDTGDGIVSMSPFKFTPALASIRLGTSLTSIGNNQFTGCLLLTSIEIPASVTSVGHDAFKGCTSLTSIYVDGANPEYASEEGVLFDKGKTRVICYPFAKQNTSYVMPETVTEFSDDAFVSGYLIDITIGKNMSRGFTVTLKNGTVTITDRDASVLSGAPHRIALERNGAEVPDTVKELAGVFDVYQFTIEGADLLEDGADISIKIDSRSKSRSVYRLYESGNYTMIQSENDYETDGTTYSFKLTQSAYFSIMAQNAGSTYQTVIFIVMVVLGTAAGGYYIYRQRKVGDGQ
ncbi:MAG: leucine-rich repeat domain-containing protein [Candidatus Methanomethylophilaceae archaeon]|nr:leucine-rich repeat domain-containing protein [Candidatus Methanomethylophilaceae archaeon]